MEQEKKKNGVVLLLVVIIVILLALVVLLATGTISFKSNEMVNNCEKSIGNSVPDTDSDNVVDNSNEKPTNDDTNNNTTTNETSTKKANSNMTDEEVEKIWNKIKGNWANIKYNDNLCVGTSIEINNFVKISKFNSDGITVWSILSFEKMDDNKYKINLVSPVNLNNKMNGSSVANYTTITVDISNISNKTLKVDFYGGTIEYTYVGENEYTVSENHQYIDGGFTQDYYCKWYKENN